MIGAKEMTSDAGEISSFMSNTANNINNHEDKPSWNQQFMQNKQSLGTKDQRL